MGGMDAIEQILKSLPVTAPPIALILHMQPGMTGIYADQLDDKINLSVKEGETGDRLERGRVLVAPSGKHMRVVVQNNLLHVTCEVGPKVQHVIPSADVLFASIADAALKDAVGVILTGIGADGAEGLLKMRQSGAETIGQNEETCAVYGMPKVAMELGAVKYQLPLGDIASKIVSLT